MNALRRAVSIALAVAENYAESSGLGDLKRANLEGSLAASARPSFRNCWLLRRLITFYVFGNATAYLLSAHASEVTVELGDVEEVLTDNGQTALHGALWELDQDIAAHATDDARLVATVSGFAEALMEKVALRAGSAPRLEPFTPRRGGLRRMILPLRAFRPASKANPPP